LIFTRLVYAIPLTLFFMGITERRHVPLARLRTEQFTLVFVVEHLSFFDTPALVAVTLYFVPVTRVKEVERVFRDAETVTRVGFFGRGFGVTRIVGFE
jgi:hypothetical protein